MDSLSGLMEVFSDFDLAAFLPELNTLLGWVEMLLRIAVMAGPLLLLGFGLLYLICPPAEANYSLGYRFWWSMASLDAWKFTHRLVGTIWTILGLILTIVMAVLCNGFRGMEPMDMVWRAMKCLGWEIVLTFLSCMVVNVVVVIVFDAKGFRRNEYE